MVYLCAIYTTKSSTNAFTIPTNRVNTKQHHRSRTIVLFQSTQSGFTINNQASHRSHIRPNSQLSYSNVIDPTQYDQNDLSIVTKDKALEAKKQFNGLTKQLPPKTSTTTTTTTTIITLEDFYNVIQECRVNNQLLLVHWSAPWCRSCQRVAPLLHRTIQQIQKLAQHQLEQGQPSSIPTNVRYINIPLLYSLSSSSLKIQQSLQQSSHHNLHAMFDITTVPYCHIYYPNIGLIQEFSITPNNNNNNKATTKTISSTTRMNTKSNKITTITTISELNQILESYMKGYCPISYE
jgi:thiol-disulfide isomerase/thioredoxin